MLRSETAARPERMKQALDGLRAYQEAPRDPPAPPLPAVWERMGCSVRDYGGAGPALLVVPSLINPPSVLDLGSDRSLLRWLSVNGFRPLLLDWGWDVEARRQLSVAGHVEQVILPFLDGINERPHMIGYCLGGTMAMAAAEAAPSRVRSLAAIAAPWRFSGFSIQARDALARLWMAASPTVNALGLLPMEVLQSAFWSLDPARTVEKFEHFATVDPASSEGKTFVTLEDWANDGPPIPEAAAREMFEGFIRDDLPGSLRWSVAGSLVDPTSIEVPLLNIVSTSDRIVPAASAAEAGERVELSQGHVGMVVGSKAKDALWKPLATWLGRHNGG